MAATLQQLRRLTRSRLGLPMTDDFMTDSVIDDHVNLALQTLESEARWPWADVVENVTLTPDIPDIVTDVSWLATRMLVCQNVELALVAPADMLRYEEISAAYPVIWCPISDAIVLRPRVTGPVDILHYWSRQSPWLREDEDIPLVPEQYSGAIIAKAAELLSARESSGADATRHGSEYSGWVTRMRRDTRRSTPPTRTRVRPGGWI